MKKNKEYQKNKKKQGHIVACVKKKIESLACDLKSCYLGKFFTDLL